MSALFPVHSMKPQVVGMPAEIQADVDEMFTQWAAKMPRNF